MITLYEFANSVCCQKVRVTMAEKGLDWSSRQINLFRNEQYDPAYLRLNPAGVVPTLVVDDDVVTESTLICEYLDERYPDPPLMPTGALDRARVRMWPKMIDDGLHEGVGAISFAAMFRERMRAMTPEQREGRFRNNGNARRGAQIRATYELGARAPQVEQAVIGFDRLFGRLETTLAERGPWIAGDRVTLADIALMPYVGRLHYMGLLDCWTRDRPLVRAWWDRAREYPSFVAGIAAPMPQAELDEMALHGPSIRAEVTEYLSAGVA